MKISVIIPAYNAAATVEAAVRSVLAQTVAPSQILVMDDGSTDETSQRLQAFESRITVLRQANRGVAHARNVLCGQATGEIIAFLDADDVWHPAYLETQVAMLERHPEAVAGITGHVTFHAPGSYRWDTQSSDTKLSMEKIEPADFLKRYNQDPGSFGSPSFCCIPKKVLAQMGQEPFPVSISGADDFYLMNILPLYGPVVYSREPRVAYRVTAGSISSNQLKSVRLAVNAFELLAKIYQGLPGRSHAQTFQLAFASKRRQYAKFLMGVNQPAEARKQLKSALANPGGLLSLLKTFGVLLSTYLTPSFQPRWPGPHRESTATKQLA